MGKYCTINEIAEFVGITTKTLRKLIRDAGLPSINIGAGSRVRYRFDLEAVKEFLNERKAHEIR